MINDQYRTNIELERIYYDTSDLVLAAVADGDVDMSTSPGHTLTAPRDPCSRRQCAHCPLAALSLLSGEVAQSGWRRNRRLTVRRFLCLVCRHVNSTLDSKHGCKGGVHNAKSRSWGLISTTDKQTPALSTPMDVFWRCDPPLTLVSQGAINAHLGCDFAITSKN